MTISDRVEDMGGEVTFTEEDEESCWNYSFKSSPTNSFKSSSSDSLKSSPTHSFKSAPSNSTPAPQVKVEPEKNKVCLWVPYNGSNDYCINYDYSSGCSSNDSGLSGVAILGQDRVRIRVSPNRATREEIVDRRESVATLYEEIDDVQGYFEESFKDVLPPVREAMPPPLPPRLFKSKSMQSVASRVKRKNLFQHLGLSQRNEDDTVVSAKKIALENMRRNVSGELSRRKDLAKYLGFDDSKLGEGGKVRRRQVISKALKEAASFAGKNKKIVSESLHDESFEELVTFMEGQENRSSEEKKKNLRKYLGLSQDEINHCESELDLRNAPNYEELKYLNNNYMPKQRTSSFSSTSTISSSSSLSSTELSTSVSDAVSTSQSPSSRSSSFSKLIRKSRRFSMSGMDLMGSIRRKSSSLSRKPSIQSLCDDKTNGHLEEEDAKDKDVDYGIEESILRNMPVIPFGKPTWVIIEEDLKNKANAISTKTEKFDDIEKDIDELYQNKDSLDYLINLAKNEIVQDRRKSPTENDEPIYMEMSHQYDQQVVHTPNFQEYMDMSHVQQIFQTQLHI